MESFLICNTPSHQVSRSYLCSHHLPHRDSIHPPPCHLSRHLGFYAQTQKGLKSIVGVPLLCKIVKKSRTTSSSMGDSVVASNRGDFKVFESRDDLATSLADYVAGLSKSATEGRGSFTVVLSGGSLINALRKLTEPPYLDTVDWGRWHVFWVDERVVAKNHPDSNYKLAYDNFLSKVPVIPGHVYAINDSLSAEAAAEDYETVLRQLAKTGILDASKGGDFPTFDLMLLGIGPDGHVASLFPGHPLLSEKEKWTTFIRDSPKPPPERITFTLPVINSAANIAVVVTGAGKAEALKKGLSDEVHDGLLPIQMVSPKSGNLTWFADKAAAVNIVI